MGIKEREPLTDAERRELNGLRVECKRRIKILFQARKRLAGKKSDVALVSSMALGLAKKLSRLWDLVNRKED